MSELIAKGNIPISNLMLDVYFLNGWWSLYSIILSLCLIVLFNGIGFVFLFPIMRKLEEKYNKGKILKNVLNFSKIFFIVIVVMISNKSAIQLSMLEGNKVPTIPSVLNYQKEVLKYLENEVEETKIYVEAVVRFGETVNTNFYSSETHPYKNISLIYADEENRGIEYNGPAQIFFSLEKGEKPFMTFHELESELPYGLVVGKYHVEVHLPKDTYSNQ